MLPILPEVYNIPKFHGSSSIKVFDDNYLLLFKPTPGGIPIVEAEDGTFNLRDKKDIPKLFKHKYNWTFSRLNEWECIFKFFTSEELFRLKQLGYLDFDNYRLHWIPGTGKMRLEKGRNTRTTRFLINIGNWCQKPFQITTLDTLRQAVDKLIELNNFIPINAISPASTSKDVLLTTGNGEFSLYNKIPLETTRFLHTCYVGPRMESRCLGTIEDVSNSDKRRAYLRALGECPSMGKGSLLKVVRGRPFSPNAHPGSGYEIEVDIPRGYSQFAPIPQRWQGRTPYPSGKFRTRVSKPYIDLLNELGDIPYTILDSVQLILQGIPLYPFRSLAQTLETFQDEYKDQFYPINLKALHYTIQGHMLHIHKTTDIDTGKISFNTGQDYNPADACAIQAMVACDLWKRSQKEETEAIRVDAISGYNLEKKPDYTEEGTGLMTFLTPSLKDKPGSTLYRDLINTWRDYPSVSVKFPMRYGIRNSWYNPRRIGKLTTVQEEIYPKAGNRDTGNFLRIQRIGELLDRRIEIPVPEVTTEDSNISGGKEVPLWIDDYLNIFPQIPQ